jgi:hypothetical protein
LFEKAGATIPNSEMLAQFLDLLCSPRGSELTRASVLGSLQLLASIFQAFTTVYDCKEEGLVPCIRESKTRLERRLYLASLGALGREMTKSIFNDAVEADLIAADGLRSYSIDASIESFKRLIVNSLF